MGNAILQWLGGRDTGLSSKAIALTALGEMPERAASQFPRDMDDFGRCYRLIKLAPDARGAIDVLSVGGGPYWAALADAWNDLTALYEAEVGKTSTAFYDRIREILDPIEKADKSVIRMGSGVTVRFGA